MPVEVDEDFIRARVEFDLAMQSASGNYTSMTKLSFSKVQLMRSADWLPRMLEAIAANTVVTELDLSSCGLTDTALQQLAVKLAVPSRCPKLKKLDISGNPEITKMGETVANGLTRLRAGLELTMGEGLDASTSGFVHDKQLVPGRSSWYIEELKPEGGGQFDFFCPKPVLEAAGEAAVAEARAAAGTADGEPLRLTRGFQGPHGTKYRTTFATFEHYHSTGNMVLITFKDPKEEGVEV